MRRVKLYMQDTATQFKTNTTTLKRAGDTYYDLAKSSNFDYVKIAKEQQSQVLTLLKQARTTLTTASITYSQMGGIVAGVQSLADYDVILASGVKGSGSGADDNDPGTNQGTVVPFDLKLPDGRVLTTPGNLFDVTESTLWGFVPQYSTKVSFDYHTGQQAVGNVLPDANVLKSAADAMDQYTGELLKAVQQWQPTLSDVFNALLQDLISVKAFFDSWESVLFVADDATRQFDMSVHSRLDDLIDAMSGWQKIYENISPLARTVDRMQDGQITKGLSDLKAYISTIRSHYVQDPQSKDFTLEKVDLTSSDAENRANAVYDQIVRVATKLKVAIQQ
ncbi:MAG: EfeM/EfeO family lipoprotein [Chloroflexi bacterium]|nr:EfeM/EfeO family lipoprotein [Chloroflexota bacterium]